jgi:hypothetical protein
MGNDTEELIKDLELNDKSSMISVSEESECDESDSVNDGNSSSSNSGIILPPSYSRKIDILRKKDNSVKAS